MIQYAFFFDQSRCIDCRACAIACRDWNDCDADARFLRRFTWEEGSFPQVTLNSLFAPCYHCEEPACAKACPNGAIVKEDRFGAVLVDEDACVGCRTCWDACPFGAPQFAKSDSGVKMVKCTMCIDRLAKGQMPACVNSCLTRALDFGPIGEIMEKYGTQRELPGMPDPGEAEPAIVFKPATPKRDLVAYDAERALELFSKGKDGTTELYPKDSIAKDASKEVRKSSLRMKIADAEEAKALLRSDEW